MKTKDALTPTGEESIENCECHHCSSGLQRESDKRQSSSHDTTRYNDVKHAKFSDKEARDDSSNCAEQIEDNELRR
jgi:hypothetical protein